ncbi:unnamed protein product, partial [Rotaria sp. Silwood2]
LNSIALWQFLYFFFGVIGNILNIFVFSQRFYRSNSCAWIFLVLSIVDLVSLVSGLSTLIIAGWTTNPSSHIGSICKIRAFLVFSTRTMATWLMVLATIDRWFLSSTNALRRQKSSLKNSQLWTTIIIILSAICYSQQLYCYEANLVDTPLQCYGKTVVCRYLTDLSLALVTVCIPVILMILFSLLIISNIRQSQRRVQILQSTIIRSIANIPSHSNNRNSLGRFKKTEHGILRMLLSQVILSIIFTSPLCLDKFYSSILEHNGSPVQLTTNAFVYDLAILIYDISNGITFYIYIFFGGCIFRKTLYEFLVSIKQKFIGH